MTKHDLSKGNSYGHAEVDKGKSFKTKQNKTTPPKTHTHTHQPRNAG